MTQSVDPTAAAALHYEPKHDFYDEVMSEDGTRPHWRYVMEGIGAMGASALSERQAKARRILRDDGATYNVYSDPNVSQIWRLDPVPLILDSNEWELVENALRERAELLNLMLNDIYGDRELIRHRVLPPELIYGHPGFLRPADGIKLPGNHQLILHASDLSRDAKGNWRVTGDRVQSPSGAGYALENRTVLSRVMPSLFRDSHVHRLSLFFRHFRQKLMQLGQGGELPRVVYLTPGPYNETYFEHVYLANYLGFPLVQGNDLTVRDGYVWIKSLEGLRKVDVIIRRVDDWFSDPVQFRNDSTLGVPGILEVARNNRVAIVNPIGAGVLENAALMKYLPAVAQHFLGRDLRLTSANTWWCGDEKDLAYVKANIDKLVLKSVFRTPSGPQSVMGDELSAQAKAEWLAKLEANGERYVAQERIEQSRVPVLDKNELTPRPVVLRSFAVASGSSYAIMPGGLSRAGNSMNHSVITNQLGAISKDTWVLASEPEQQAARVTDDQVHLLEGHDADLPSRVLENLYWFGRYAERAEQGLRLLRTVFEQSNGVDALPAPATPQLHRSVTHVTMTYPGFAEPEAPIEHPERELLSVILDRQREGSIASTLGHMLHSADGVREMLSADMVRLTTDVRDELVSMRKALQPGRLAAPEEALDPMVTVLLALSGLSQESMVRGVAWQFLDIGRRLERGLQTISLLRSLLVPVPVGVDPLLMLKPTLISLEAMITYRRRYQGQFDIANGLELLLLDAKNPRSLLFQMQRLQEHLEQFAVKRNERRLPEDQKLLLKARNLLILADLDELAKLERGQFQRADLDALLAELADLLAKASLVVTGRYFDHVGGPKPLDVSS